MIRPPSTAALAVAQPARPGGEGRHRHRVRVQPRGRSARLDEQDLRRGVGGHGERLRRRHGGRLPDAVRGHPHHFRLGVPRHRVPAHRRRALRGVRARASSNGSPLAPARPGTGGAAGQQRRRPGRRTRS
ncbi:MAG: hypothetical protein MZW92_40410 [Comamonadaceae bacterium]|nr:hypothetical protein [Comamonadaceae bacterium]